MNADRLRWAAVRLRDLATLDLELLRSPQLSPPQRRRLLVDRYRAMARGEHTLPYLGHRLHYDNRLMPALMPSYLSEIGRLDRLVGLAGATVLDVGANIGQFAATVSWQFPGTRIWSFEPNEEIHPLLRENAAQSAGWQVVPWGVGERDEVVSFYVVPGKSGQGSTQRANATANLEAGPAVERRVRLAPLTEAFRAELGIPERVHLVKVDVEGAEASALTGLRSVRWRYLAIETSLHRHGGLDLEQTCDLVQELWGTRPHVRWQGTASADATTQDAILELVPEPTDDGPDGAQDGR